jgi:hypothetical protein
MAMMASCDAYFRDHRVEAARFATEVRHGLKLRSQEREETSKTNLD